MAVTVGGSVRRARDATGIRQARRWASVNPFDRAGSWKHRHSVLSWTGAIRAHPVHGKGTSHLNRNLDEE
jgi:hypothetical protein